MLKVRMKTAPALRATIASEAVYFEAFYRNDFERSQHWQQQIGKRINLVPILTRRRAEAAVKILQRDFDMARQITLEADKTLAPAKDGISLGERRLLAKILEKIDQLEGRSAEAVPMLISEEKL
jgi:hypothetical protein